MPRHSRHHSQSLESSRQQHNDGDITTNTTTTKMTAMALDNDESVGSFDDSTVPLEEGQRWYVVSMKWFSRYRQWAAATGDEDDNGSERTALDAGEAMRAVRAIAGATRKRGSGSGSADENGGGREQQESNDMGYYNNNSSSSSSSGGSNIRSRHWHGQEELKGEGEEELLPGPIDNSDIVERTLQQPDVEAGGITTVVVLRGELEEGLDFITVSEDTFWNRLYKRFSTDEESGTSRKAGDCDLYQIIERRVIVDGDESHRMLRIDLYPLVLNVAMAAQIPDRQGQEETTKLGGVVLENLVRTETRRQIMVSRKSTLEHLKKLVRTMYDLRDQYAMRLWTTMGDTLVLVPDNERTREEESMTGSDDTKLEDALVYHNQHIVIEVHDVNDMQSRWALDTIVERQQKFEHSNDNTSAESVSDSALPSASTSPSSPDGESMPDNLIRRKRRKLSEERDAETLVSKELENSSTSTSPDHPYPTGVCGLQNLGNTCFMNSALQCLSNTQRLCEYFVSGRYRDHINHSNPLGMQGKLAQEYGDLMAEMWSSTRRSVAPISFKRALGQFAPQFSGYKQQDAQELLAFLLDGLHEDVNRVHDKPYVEQSESGGRPDDVVAREAWMHHLRRNRSVIVDLFQGQLKSTLVCPECDNVSIKFDPFMFLSVPIPDNRTLFKVDVVFMQPSPTIEALEAVDPSMARRAMSMRPTKYSLEINSDATIGVLAHKFGHMFHKDPRGLVFMDLAGCKIRSVLEADDPVESIVSTSQTILCFQEPPFESYNIVHVVQRTKLMQHPSLPPHRHHYHAGATNGKDGTFVAEEPYQLINIPFSLFLPSAGQDTSNKVAITGRQLYELVMFHVRRLCIASYRASAPIDLFTLSYADFTGKACKPEKCFKEICHGCDIPCDDTPITDLEDLDTLALTWHNPSVLNRNECMKVVLDPSVKKHREKLERDKTLDDCLQLFGEVEQLSVNDPWFCPQCRDLRQAYKRFECWSLPDVLVVHLKRFIFDRRRRQKNRTMVDFPLELDMAPYMVEPPDHPVLYRLYAVSNHSGSLGSGHYTAFARNRHDSQWYLFNDSASTQIDQDSLVEHIVTNAAYVLCYERVYDEGSASVSPVSATPTSPDEDTAEEGRMTDADSNGARRLNGIHHSKTNGNASARPYIRLSTSATK